MRKKENSVLKFRAFDKYNNKMISEFIVFSDGSVSTCEEIEAYTYELGKRIDPSYVMQFTGVSYKKRDIYKYDIFQFGTNKDWLNGDGERGYIAWDYNLSAWVIHFCSIHGGEGYTGSSFSIESYIKACKGKCKLIGNCFENPDLLTIGFQ